MFTGPVDTDMEALAVRERLNSRGNVNLENLLIQKLNLVGYETVLELGCGNGKQTKVLRENFPHMPIIAVDVAAAANKVDIPATVIKADMDYLLFSPLFDVVLSVYSFYYSRNMQELAMRIAYWLKPGGRLLLMGPGAGTNQELVELVNATGKYTLPAVEDFLSYTQLEDMSRPFADCEVSYHKNVICCQSKAEFLGWWENHNSYNPEARAYLEAAGMIPDCMKLTKNVMCVVFNGY